MIASATREQLALARRVGVEPRVLDGSHKVGVAANVRDGATLPLNGLRHPPVGDTTGWYIWAGESIPDDPDFFMPLHVEHLGDWCPSALPFLVLPPGWRFLLAPGHEEVWFDATLLDA